MLCFVHVHGRRILCNGIERMSAMKTVIVTLCLIVSQMQVSTALDEDSSKSLMAQYREPGPLMAGLYK